MISRTGFYISTGITLTHRATSEGSWASSLTFIDEGFCNDMVEYYAVSTEGTLSTRYYVSGAHGVTGLDCAVGVLIKDAHRLGIAFRDPFIYYRGDGEYPDFPPPPGWRKLLADHANKIGWRSYDTPVEKAIT
jgi:hypothetical protein